MTQDLENPRSLDENKKGAPDSVEQMSGVECALKSREKPSAEEKVYTQQGGAR